MVYIYTHYIVFVYLYIQYIYIFICSVCCGLCTKYKMLHTIESVSTSGPSQPPRQALAGADLGRAAGDEVLPAPGCSYGSLPKQIQR